MGLQREEDSRSNQSCSIQQKLRVAPRQQGAELFFKLHALSLMYMRCSVLFSTSVLC